MPATVTTGEQTAAAFVDRATGQFQDTIGFAPYAGTLNLEGSGGVPDPTKEMPWKGSDHCAGVAYEPCYISGVRAAVIRPDVPNYPAEKTELLAPVRLRDLFDIEDGDPLLLAEQPWAPDGLTTTVDKLDAFDVVVFDFDGTLAELAVDWASIHTEIADLLDPYLNQSLNKYERHEIFRIARESGVYGDVESLLTNAEAAAVDESTAREELEKLSSLNCPIGICTANASGPVRSFLERHDVAGTVGSIIARDTITEDKPDPRPVLRCVEELGGEPGNAVFVGDERTDAAAAHRAATSFLHPKQLRDCT